MKLTSKILLYVSAALLFVLGLIYLVVEVRMLIAGDFLAYSNPTLGAFVMVARTIVALLLLAPLCFHFFLPKTKIFAIATVSYGGFLFVFAVVYKFVAYGQKGIDNYLGIAFMALTALYLASRILNLIALLKQPE